MRWVSLVLLVVGFLGMMAWRVEDWRADLRKEKGRPQNASPLWIFLAASGVTAVGIGGALLIAKR